jgi:hypothetical protein
MSRVIFNVFILDTFLQFVFLFLQDYAESFKKSGDTEIEVPLVRKITKHEISENILIFSE